MCKECSCGDKLEKVIVWFSIQNGGDGSAYPKWFLTEEDSEIDQDGMEEGWGEPCNGSAETFVGSDIHRAATENSMKKEYIKTMNDILEQKEKYDWVIENIFVKFFTEDHEYFERIRGYMIKDAVDAI